MRPWSLLVVAASGIGTQQEPAPAPIDQLILTRGLAADPSAKSVREAFEEFRRRVKELADPAGVAGTPGEKARELRQEVRAIDVSTKDTQSRVAPHLGLTVHRATRAAHAASGFAFDYQPTLGVLRVFGFDERRGFEASVSLKLENDRAGDEEAEEEAEHEIEELFESLGAAWRAEQTAADAPADAPYQETIRWDGAEDPPEPGFRWSNVREGAETRVRVTFLVANGSLAQAGLRRGDDVVSVNGTAVATPPVFGRAIAGLAAGAPLVLEVRRGSERATVKGVVHQSSELLPAFEQGLIGAPLPAFRADVGAPPVEIGGAEAPQRATATLVLVFDPRQPDTLADVAQLAWIREHFSAEEVAIAGIGAYGAPDALRKTMEELAPGWPAAADPDGRLAEATRSLALPALLLADREGIVRFRRARGGALLHALRGLLAAPPR